MAAVTEEKAVPHDSADLDPLIGDTNAALQSGFKDEFSDELECEEKNTEDNNLEATSNGDISDQAEANSNSDITEQVETNSNADISEQAEANSNADITDQVEANSNGDENDQENIDNDTINDDVLSAGSSNDEINDEPIDDDIISGGGGEGMTVDEDQDTEGDDVNDAEEIDAGDSLEETEFVEGGDGEETELIDDTMEDDGDPLMDDTDNPLMDDTENGDPDVDPLMGEDEEDVNGLEYPKDETDVGEEEGMEGMEEGEDDIEGQEEDDQDQTGGGTKRKSEEGESSDVSVRKSSRIKIRNDNRKEKEASLLEGKSVHDKQQSRIKMLQRPSERPRQVSDDEGGGSGEEGADQSDQEKEDDTVDSIEPKTQTPLGDPSKPPGVGAARKIDIDFLVPFQFGWSREVVVRPVKSGPQQFDIFYWPPKDGPDYGARNREATRKRRSKVDIEKYFEEFKSKLLSVNNFTFVRRPLELNNEAYEIVRHSKPSLETRSDKRTRKATVRYKEVAEHEGLLSGDSSNEEGDKGDEIEEVTDFDQGLPLSLQIIQRTTPFREESKKRKKFPDRERCVTPPTAAEIGWTVLDDDPLGIYTDLGGRSSPATPPPLRAVRLTSHNTVTSFREKLNEIKEDLVDPLIRVKQGNKDVELKENLATHDTAIKKYKNMRVPSLPFSRNQLPNSKHGVPRLSQGGRPGGGRPVPGNRPVSTPGSVKVKLPILSTNGKRPSVELVMLTNGKYQPIKFTNNRQVTESIPKRLFDQANHMKKTLYQRSIQVPKIGTKPVFVAVNPSPQGYKPFIQNTVTRPQVLSSEQVSILVRPAQGGNAVLLNVPKHVAIKVKVGTTLSFSASSDLKYTVMDNKMHPPVGKRPPQPPQNQNRTPKGGRQMPNLPAGVSIRPISGATNGRSGSGNNGRRSVGGNSAAISVVQQRNNQAKSARRSAPSAPSIPTVDLTDFSPCSPFCPGVSGIPELECSVCHSLFHPKCVGIPQSMVPQIRAQFQCKACRSRSGGGSTIQVIELD